MSRPDNEAEQKDGYGERLKEITAVLKKHSITRGVSPEKLRLILEDLGPTYIKLGQLMSLRSDILPKRYCDELMKLCSDVPPMPFSEVIEVLEESMGCPWQAEFKEIQVPHPLHRFTGQRSKQARKLSSKYSARESTRRWQGTLA